jgi:predicted RNase H-like nuclease
VTASRGVLGIDACPGGWVGIALADGGARAFFAPNVAALVDATAQQIAIDAIAIDIPIGVPPHGVRAADLLARERLGRRAATLFVVPSRAVLQAPDHAAAVGRCRERGEKGVSRQAFGLARRIFEVEDWLGQQPPGSRPVVEVHPELSFQEMAGGPLPASKATWSGLVARRKLLQHDGIDLPDDIGTAGLRAGADDVLDAAAAAWTAVRVSRSTARSLPNPPQDLDGVAAAIWI